MSVINCIRNLFRFFISIGILIMFKKIVFTALAAMMSMNVMAKDIVSLKFSDGKPDIAGLKEVNKVLNTVGVHITTVDIPIKAKEILAHTENRSLTKQEQDQIGQYFKLSREQLLGYVKMAGRKPAVAGGGHLEPKENGNGYPYVFDLSTVKDANSRKHILEKYGRLHVNSANDGTDLDEVMTVVSGGPLRWAFTLKDGSVARLDVAPVGINDKAVRVIYHGMGMHAGILDAEKGVFVGYGHGPKEFTIRYQYDNLPHAKLLNTNPWIDYNYAVPKVVDQPIPLTK